MLWLAASSHLTKGTLYPIARYTQRYSFGPVYDTATGVLPIRTIKESRLKISWQTHVRAISSQNSGDVHNLLKIEDGPHRVTAGRRSRKAYAIA